MKWIVENPIVVALSLVGALCSIYSVVTSTASLFAVAILLLAVVAVLLSLARSQSPSGDEPIQSTWGAGEFANTPPYRTDEEQWGNGPTPTDSVGERLSFKHRTGSLDTYWAHFVRTELHERKAGHYQTANEQLRTGHLFANDRELQIELGNEVEAWVAEAFDVISTAYPGIAQPSKRKQTIARLYMAAWLQIKSGDIIEFDNTHVAEKCSFVADKLEAAIRQQMLMFPAP